MLHFALRDLLLIDAHVHLHPCFDLAATLDAAYANFARIAAQRFGGVPFTGVLYLTEGTEENGFDRLLRLYEGQQVGSHSTQGTWRLQPTEEHTSIILTRGAGHTLVVIAGAQVATKEGLEVLALGTRSRNTPGRPIDEALAAATDQQALPVVPWGFGKWMGARGRYLRHLLEHPPPLFFLGDNANRPAFGRPPALFHLAETNGVAILPGSDPLPFATEESRPGCCGFALRGFCSPQRPARDLYRKLSEPGFRPNPFGTFERPLRFVRNQLAMQYLKWTRPGRTATR